MRVQGVGEYSASWSGVGQLAEETLVTPALVQPRPPPLAQLDLRDPEAAKQLKVAMGLSPFMVPFVFGDRADADFDERFFADPVWGRLSTKFARLWIEGFKKTFPSIPPEGLLNSPHLDPTAAGVLMTLVTLGYRGPGPHIVDFAHLGKLTAFFDATGGDSKEGVVLAPLFSREEQDSGAFPVKASTIAFAGFGLLGLVALGVVLGGKKRRS